MCRSFPNVKSVDFHSWHIETRGCREYVGDLSRHRWEDPWQEVQRRIIKSSSVAQLSSLMGNPRGKPCPLPNVSCPENKRARNLTEFAQFLSSSEGLAGGLRRFLILLLDMGLMTPLA